MQKKTLVQEFSINSIGPENVESRPKKSWMTWLFKGHFYLYGVIYSLGRVSLITTMALQCFYLKEVTKFTPTPQNPTPLSLATVPLIQYILGMMFSLHLQTRLTKYFKNRMYLMLLSVFVTSVSSIPLALLSKETQMFVYPLVAL